MNDYNYSLKKKLKIMDKSLVFDKNTNYSNFFWNIYLLLL